MSIHAEVLLFVDTKYGCCEEAHISECRCSGVKKSHSQPEFSHFAVSLHVQKKEREKKNKVV